MLPLVALLQSGDDTAWINSGIQAAIRQGRTSYSIPAGVYTLSSPVLIPAGTRNFALRGAGSNRTIITVSDPKMKQAIQVGALPQLHNNWMITGPGNLAVNNVAAGSSTLKLSKAVPVLPGGYYVLWDPYKVVCAKGPNVSMNHAEVVRAVGYSPDGTIKLDVPTGREYGPKAQIAPYELGTCANVEVSGFGFRGSTSDGLVAVGIVDGATLSDLDVEGFRSDAIMTNTSRRVRIDNVNVSLASDGDAGSGYGVSIYRSRFVTITNSTASQCRHGFLMHSGSMDVTVSNCYTPNGFDMHGYDERRIALVNCTGDGGDVGNDAWLAGARDVLIQRCSFTDPIGFHANVRNVRVVDSQLGGVAVYSAEAGTTPTVGVPAEGYADGVRFDRCSLSGSGFTLFWENGANRMGTFTFKGCDFENLSTGWGTIFDVGTLSGTIEVTDSTLNVASADHVIQIASPGQGFHFRMARCNLQGQGNLAVWIKSIFTGSAAFIDNNYLTAGPYPQFLYDDTHRALDIRNTAGGLP